MALVVREAYFDEGNKSDKKLTIGGNSRTLYIRGSGFISSDFPLELIIPENDGSSDGVDVHVSPIGEDISEKTISVNVTATKKKEGKIVEGNRDVVLKKSGSSWDRDKCAQNDKNDNAECALLEDAIYLVE